MNVTETEAKCCRRCVRVERALGRLSVSRSSPFLWTCRVCERRTCEHLCGNKDEDGKATCVRCRMTKQPNGSK